MERSRCPASTMLEARYRIPGRSFRIEMEVTNHGDLPLSIGEMAAGNLRFINAAVKPVEPADLLVTIASFRGLIDAGSDGI